MNRLAVWPLLPKLNYVISEQIARRIRDYASSFMELGGNCVGKADCPQAGQSFYVDSDHLQTRWDTLNRNKNRFRLTIRLGPLHVNLCRVATGTGTFEMGVGLGDLQFGGTV